jgi:Ca-activated chloride channel family protein
VADVSGGKFFEAASASQLRKVYDDIQGRVGYTTEQREVSRGFLGFALVIVFAAAGVSLLWTGRYL